MSRLGGWCVVAVALIGCHHPEITAVSLSPQNACEEPGIPFYLPKPLLIISKNFRYIEEAKVGLTDGAPIPNGFDDQSKYGDVNARLAYTDNATSFPAPNTAGTSGGTGTASGQHLYSENGAPITPRTAPSDGLAPETFYTYQIVFVPDLTQKYGLRVKGGAGELRAAMNLVNGWQFTGMGPYYMKDSSTAQNLVGTGLLASLTGRGVSDVVKSVADLAGKAGGLQSGERAFDASDKSVVKLSESLQQLGANVQPMVIPNFAEIHVYEARLTLDQQMEWVELANLCFTREALGHKTVETTKVPLPQSPADMGGASTGGLQSGERGVSEASAQFARQAVAHVLGISPDSPALLEGRQGELQSGERSGGSGGAGTGGNSNVCTETKECNLIKFGDHNRSERRRPRVTSQRVVVPPVFGATMPASIAIPNPTGNEGGATKALERDSRPNSTGPGTALPPTENPVMTVPKTAAPPGQP
ncbi:MAG: hypothetical protein ACKV0T_22250 [Planctomycetales bacterium]